MEEVVPPQKPVWDSSNVDVRVAAVKPRPTSRCFAVASEMNVSIYVETYTSIMFTVQGIPFAVVLCRYKKTGKLNHVL